MLCMIAKHFLIIYLVLILMGCKDDAAPKPIFVGGQNTGNGASGDSDTDLEGTDFNVLFVGNSLTYTNNLPILVKEQAAANGITVGTKMIALPNYAISDHWDNGAVQEYIKSKKYDFVVVQQGPSSQSEGRQILLEYGKYYSDLCNENDAKLAFFMVWPSRTYYFTFDGVIKNYRDAALSTNSILCPVGEVWKQHFDSTEDYSYYGNDGFHPSLTGSEIAADVIVKSLF